MYQSWKSLGLLRNMLHLVALLLILVLPFADPMWHPETVYELFMGAIIPATAPIVFVVIMFDVLMSSVMKSGYESDETLYFGRVIKWHLAIGFTLLASLSALAILEHWLMVLPLPDAKLWRWMLPARDNETPDLRPEDAHGL